MSLFALIAAVSAEAKLKPDPMLNGKCRILLDSDPVGLPCSGFVVLLKDASKKTPKKDITIQTNPEGMIRVQVDRSRSYTVELVNRPQYEVKSRKGPFSFRDFIDLEVTRNK